MQNTGEGSAPHDFSTVFISLCIALRCQSGSPSCTWLMLLKNISSVSIHSVSPSLVLSIQRRFEMSLSMVPKTFKFQSGAPLSVMQRHLNHALNQPYLYLYLAPYVKIFNIKVQFVSASS